MSTYRASLLESNGTLGDHFQVLTDQQFAKFAMWSLQLNKPVLDLMSGLMVESMKDENTVRIEGVFPNCALYGCMLPDGSTHT
jgi:hypothetical protein